MKQVSYNEFCEFTVKNGAIQGQPDFDQQYVTVDFWDSERKNLVGYIRYWNDGKIEHVLTENSSTQVKAIHVVDRINQQQRSDSDWLVFEVDGRDFVADQVSHREDGIIGKHVKVCLVPISQVL